MDGKTRREVPGLAAATTVLRWSPDGRALWVRRQQGGSIFVGRVDVATGARSVLTQITLAPGVPVFRVGQLNMADDPSVYAYRTVERSSFLFTVDGIR